MVCCPHYRPWPTGDAVTLLTACYPLPLQTAGCVGTVSACIVQLRELRF